MNKFLTILRRHWKPLLALNVGLLALTVVIATFYPRTWTASARFILPNMTGSLDASLGTLGELNSSGLTFSTEVNPTMIQSSILMSDSVLRRVWAKDPDPNRSPLLENYRKLFKATVQDQSTIIAIEVSGSSIELARSRAQTLVQTYQARLNELRQDDAGAHERFSRDELEQARATLVSAQLALSRFKQATGLVDIDEQTRALAGSISTLTASQVQALSQGKAAEVRARVLAARLGMTPRQAIDSLRLGENKEYQMTRQKLADVEVALAEARGLYTDKNARVRSLLLQREELLLALKERIAQAAPGVTSVDGGLGGNNYRDGRIDLIVQLIGLESEASGLARQADQVQQRLDGLDSTLRSIGKNQGQLLDLQRKYDIAEGIYKGLVAQVQQAKVSAFNAYPNVQVLDQPTVDFKPSSPKLSLIVLGALLASALGSIAIALLLEGRNPLLGPKDLQGVEFPVLARIPLLKGRALESDLEAETGVEFQRLASAVSLMPLENGRLMVSSSSFGEGKTTVTLGLAIALADLGFRVLLVDGDFRRAELSRRLGYTRDGVLQSMLVHLRPELDLVPTMPRQSRVMELVARGRFERSLETLHQSGDYDYVLVDSAPLGLTSESALMAAAVRNVLFVIRPGTSDRNMVNDSIEQLEQHNARIVGLSINGVQTRSEGYRYARNISQGNV